MPDTGHRWKDERKPLSGGPAYWCTSCGEWREIGDDLSGDCPRHRAEDVMPDTPIAGWSGSFMLGSVEIKCHVLDNGQRIIEAESVAALFEAMGDPGFTFADADMEAFARWQKGLLDA